LSNTDIRSSGTASNTLGASAVTSTLDSSVIETAALAGLSTMTYTGHATITVGSGVCSDATYLCVSVLAVGSPYTDDDPTNNYRCKVIVEQLSCAVGEHLKKSVIFMQSPC